MDILNFISWLKGGRIVKTINPSQSLIPIATRDSKRDDQWLTNAITAEDLGDQIGGLQTVSVDGVTITGNGTSQNVLKTTAPKTYVANISQSSTSNPAINVVFNNTGVSLTFTRTGQGVYESNIVDIPVLSNFITFTCSNGETGTNGVGRTIFTTINTAGGNNKYFTIETFANTTNSTTILTTGNNDNLLSKAIIEIKIYI